MLSNALSSALMKELVAALDDFEEDDEIHTIIITGSDRVFSAGADIKDMSELTSVQALKEGNLERFRSTPESNKTAHCSG